MWKVDEALNKVLASFEAIIQNPDPGTAYTRVNVDWLRNVVRDLKSIGVSAVSSADGFEITKEWIREHTTKSGGWTMAQLDAIGVKWPPQNGWINKLAGTQISFGRKKAFEERVDMDPKAFNKWIKSGGRLT